MSPISPNAKGTFYRYEVKPGTAEHGMLENQIQNGRTQNTKSRTSNSER